MFISFTELYVRIKEKYFPSIIPDCYMITYWLPPHWFMFHECLQSLSTHCGQKCLRYTVNHDTMVKIPSTNMEENWTWELELQIILSTSLIGLYIRVTCGISNILILAHPSHRYWFNWPVLNLKLEHPL